MKWTRSAGRSSRSDLEDERKRLIVSGFGAIPNYPKKAPWTGQLDQIQMVAVLGGVEAIGDFAFSKLASLKEVELHAGLRRIWGGAFTN